MSWIRPIGGDFPVETALLSSDQARAEVRFLDLTDQDCREGFASWVSSGRAAFFHALEGLPEAGTMVLLPEFLCAESLVAPVLARGLTPAFYPVNADLTIREDDLLGRIGPDVGAVLLILYFGIVRHPGLAEKIRSAHPSARVIIDAVQDPFILHRTTRSEQSAHTIFTSFSKSLPVPDGAAVRSRMPLRPPAVTRDAGPAFLHALAGGILKDFYQKNLTHTVGPGFEQVYLDHFMASKAARAAPDGYVRGMSAFSRELLRRLPLSAYMSRRRRNYAHLAGRLKDSGVVTVLYESLPEDAVPLFLPVRVHGGRRDDLRASLSAGRVFCPVHWPLTKKSPTPVGDDAGRLYEELLSLVVDQRYDTNDMERQADLVGSFH